MKRSLFLTIFAVIPAFFGVMFFLAPEKMLGNFGFAIDTPMKILGYSIGSLLISVGCLNFLSRNVTEHAAVRAVLLTNVSVQVLTGGVDLYGTLTGAMSADGWGAVVMHVLFLTGFLYYLVKK